MQKDGVDRCGGPIAERHAHWTRSELAGDPERMFRACATAAGSVPMDIVHISVTSSRPGITVLYSFAKNWLLALRSPLSTVH